MKIPTEIELRVEQDGYSDTGWVGEVLLFGVIIYRNGYLVMCDTEEDAIERLKSAFAYSLGELIPNDEPDSGIRS